MQGAGPVIKPPFDANLLEYLWKMSKRKRGPAVLTGSDLSGHGEHNRCWRYLRSIQHLRTSRFNRHYDAFYEDDGEEGALEHDGGDYLPPKGWCKFGLEVNGGLKEHWGISYHGTTQENLADIVTTGELRAPGEQTSRGRVERRSGHRQWDEPYIFTSITPRYASLYAKPVYYNGFYYQTVLMLRQNRTLAEPIGNTKPDLWGLDIRLDANVSNSKLGYYTKYEDSLQLYAVLVKEHTFHPHDSDLGDLAKHKRKRLRQEA